MQTFSRTTSKIKVSDPKVLVDGIYASSEAFIQFSEEAPDWYLRDISRGLNKGWIKLKVAKIVEEDNNE